MRGAADPAMGELLAQECVPPDTTVSEQHTQPCNTRPTATGALSRIDGLSDLQLPRFVGADDEQQPLYRSLIRFTIAARTVLKSLPRWEATASVSHRYCNGVARYMKMSFKRN